jgi:DNA-binding beta-propeller fold protein YncE
MLPCVVFFSCKKDKDQQAKTEPVISDYTHAFILNEGLFNLNNSTLTYYKAADGTVTQDYFALKNHRGLGDTGNDIKLYGGKVYVVVNVSSQLEVMDREGNSLKRIPFFNGIVPREPRYIAFSGSKAYVCSFDGTVARIDTTTLEIETLLTVGKNPDGICVANNKLYVSNSGGLDYPVYDSSVSVIDIPSFTETKKIKVRINPSVIIPDSHGDVYVISRGNYDDIKYCLQRINTATDQLVQTFTNIEPLGMAIDKDTAYIYNYDYTTQASTFYKLNVNTEQLITSNFISDGTVIQTPYGISVDAATGDVYIADAYGFSVNGDMFCLSSQGKKKFKFAAGLNPQRMVFIR